MSSRHVNHTTSHNVYQNPKCVRNVSVMCDGFYGIRKGNKIDRYRSHFSTPVADRYDTNYPPEFLNQVMVAQHQVRKWGDFDWLVKLEADCWVWPEVKLYVVAQVRIWARRNLLTVFWGAPSTAGYNLWFDKDWTPAWLRCKSKLIDFTYYFDMCAKSIVYVWSIKVRSISFILHCIFIPYLWSGEI